MYQYHPLDISRGGIRLVSFENTTEETPLRLNLHHVSLHDWKPEYAAFRDRSTATTRSQLAAAWEAQFDTEASKPLLEYYKDMTKFTWGDYACLSYADMDRSARERSILLDGITVPVTAQLQAALLHLRSTFECRAGLKVWVDALCIDQADIADRSAHVLRIRDIFGGASSVKAWTWSDDDPMSSDFDQAGENLALCGAILSDYGQRVLEELLGFRQRDWGAAEDEDDKLQALARGVDALTFDEVHWEDSSDSDDFGFGELHLRDTVHTELLFLFRRGYWSRLWTIQELAVSPTTSTVHWGGWNVHLSTLQTIGGIILTHAGPEDFHPGGIFDRLRLGLDILAFTSRWAKLETTTTGATECSFDTDSIQELNSLAGRTSCPLLQDKVYGLLGLFPSSVSSAVTVDYSRDATEVMSEFCSVVPDWNSA